MTERMNRLRTSLLDALVILVQEQDELLRLYNTCADPELLRVVSSRLVHNRTKIESIRSMVE